MGLFGLFGPPNVEKMKAKKDVKGLIKALGHEDWDVREAAAEALGQIGDARGVEPLIAALQDEYSSVRSSAAKGLVKIGDPRAVKPLIAALRDEGEYMRKAAARGLSKMRWRPDDGADGAAYWIAKGKWDRCANIGEPAVEPLLAALRYEDWDVRQAAAKALGEIGAPAVEPLHRCAQG